MRQIRADFGRMASNFCSVVVVDTLGLNGVYRLLARRTIICIPPICILFAFLHPIGSNKQQAVTAVTRPRKGILASSIPFWGLALRRPIHVIGVSDFKIIGAAGSGQLRTTFCHHSTLTNDIRQLWLSLMLMMIGQSSPNTLKKGIKTAIPPPPPLLKLSPPCANKNKCGRRVVDSRKGNISEGLCKHGGSDNFTSR